MSISHRVRKGSVYRYDPVSYDRADPPYGVKAGILARGDHVRVIHPHGCPAPNTMGMCHIETLAEEFAGLVFTNSLKPLEGDEHG